MSTIVRFMFGVLSLLAFAFACLAEILNAGMRPEVALLIAIYLLLLSRERGGAQ